MQAPPCGSRALALALLLLAGPALAAGPDPEEVVLEDRLQIVLTPRAVLAFDGEGGGDREERLELGEEVVWRGSRGNVGVVLTDRRLLMIGVGSGSWQETRWRRGETRPQGAEIGGRVALVVTDKRLLGFDGGSGNLVEGSLGPRERVLTTSVSTNLAIAVTGRRAFGLSPFKGGFFETDLRVGERLEGLDALSDVATLTTSRRLLTFRGRTGHWSERRLELR